MKKTKRRHPAEPGVGTNTSQPPAEFRPRAWHLFAGAALALFVALLVYGPALAGPFLFDDVYLPFYQPEFAEAPIRVWMQGMRPALMFTFWVSYRISGVDPAAYHLFNVAIHTANALMVFLLSRKILRRAGIAPGRQTVFAVSAAAMFLLHPLQTESVAYIASRSECLSGFLFLAAFTIFLYKAVPAISFASSFAVLALFGIACLVKEHTVVLPALLLLTDYYWNPGFSFQGIRRNWRLYLPMTVGGALAGAFVMRVLLLSQSAGFGMKDLPWHHYFWTQCRVIWTYIKMTILPIGLNIDHDYRISRGAMDYFAIAGLLGLAALTGLAIYYRRRFPVASYGWLVFLLLLAPTSSVVPIRDVIAERRMYLPLIGLLLIAIDVLSRARERAVAIAGLLAAVLLIAATLTWNRNKVWASPFALWQDSVAKSPRKARPHFQLALACFYAGRCGEANQHYETAASLEPPEPALLIDWALALDCANRTADALAKLEQAATSQRTAHVYSLIGMMNGRMGRRDAALSALAVAVQLNPSYVMTFVYRGNVYVTGGEFDLAAAEYARALDLNPHNEDARIGLAVAQRRRKP